MRDASTMLDERRRYWMARELQKSERMDERYKPVWTAIPDDRIQLLAIKFGRHLASVMQAERAESGEVVYNGRELYKFLSGAFNFFSIVLAFTTAGSVSPQLTYAYMVYIVRIFEFIWAVGLVFMTISAGLWALFDYFILYPFNRFCTITDAARGLGVIPVPKCKLPWHPLWGHFSESFYDTAQTASLLWRGYQTFGSLIQVVRVVHILPAHLIRHFRPWMESQRDFWLVTVKSTVKEFSERRCGWVFIPIYLVWNTFWWFVIGFVASAILFLIITVPIVALLAKLGAAASILVRNFRSWSVSEIVLLAQIVFNIIATSDASFLVATGRQSAIITAILGSAFLENEDAQFKKGREWRRVRVLFLAWLMHEMLHQCYQDKGASFVVKSYRAFKMAFVEDWPDEVIIEFDFNHSDIFPGGELFQWWETTWSRLATMIAGEKEQQDAGGGGADSSVVPSAGRQHLPLHEVNDPSPSGAALPLDNSNEGGAVVAAFDEADEVVKNRQPAVQAPASASSAAGGLGRGSGAASAVARKQADSLPPPALVMRRARYDFID